MFTAYGLKKDRYKLWLIGIIIVFPFKWKWALFVTIGYTALLFSKGMIEWWIDSRFKGQDGFQ